MTEPALDCLDENKVVEFIQGLLSPEARRKIEAHLDECVSCRTLMAEVAKLSFAGSSRTLPPEEPPDTASVRTPTGSSRELLPEQVLAGRFRIIRRLGRGSFGNVYEAQDLQLDERVALKLLRPEVRDNPGLLGHLHHEIVVGRRVSHPNVCRIYDLGTCGDIHFISMALIPGQGLDRLLEKGQPPVEKVHTILLQICEALEAAHRQGVVHRDLKPSNIMVHEDGSGELNITVMDFGLSRDLRAGPSMSGALIGSPAYWSPEQARGERATARSDIYSLGLIGCDLFGVKHPPFGAVTGLDVVPDAYRAVITRCLSGEAGERHGSAREVRNALVGASKHARIRRRRIRAIGGTALAAFVGGAAAMLLLTIVRAPPSSTNQPDRGAAELVSRKAAEAGRVADRGVRVALAAADAGRPGLTPTAKVRPPRKGKLVAAGKKEPDPALELAPVRPPDAAPAPRPTPKPKLALTGLQERLTRLEAARRRRGILIDDPTGGRGKRDQVRRALAAGQDTTAQTLLGALEEALRQVKIDGTFVSRKLAGLNEAKRTMQLPEATEKKVAAIFGKVHQQFFSGDFEGANAQLNSIWCLLGRGD